MVPLGTRPWPHILGQQRHHGYRDPRVTTPCTAGSGLPRDRVTRGLRGLNAATHHREVVRQPESFIQVSVGLQPHSSQRRTAPLGRSRDRCHGRGGTRMAHHVLVPTLVPRGEQALQETWGHNIKALILEGGQQNADVLEEPCWVPSFKYMFLKFQMSYESFQSRTGASGS